MSHRRRKLTLTSLSATGPGHPPGARAGPERGQPARDDPELPALVRLDRLSARPQTSPTITPSPGPPLTTRYAAATDIGMRRERNEDAFTIDATLGLFAVFDGVGGRAGGGIAAALAALTIREWIEREASTLRALASSSRDDAAVACLGALVRDAIQGASRAVWERAQSHRRFDRMCTTASVVVVANDLAVVGQVGDSRIYLGRGAGVHQLTEDHTLHNLQVQLGLTGPEPGRGRRSPITRALGQGGAVEVDVGALRLSAGDRLLLCSDGLHEHITGDDELRPLFQLDVRDAAPAAIDLANRRGGRDNITALFVELVDGAPP